MSEPRPVIELDLYRSVRRIDRGLEERVYLLPDPEYGHGTEYYIEGRVPSAERGTRHRAVPSQDQEETQAYIRRHRRERAEGQAQWEALMRRRNRTPSMWLVAFTEGNRIIEFDRNFQQRRQLTFPVRPRRRYYRIGDYVLTSENSRRLMARAFPELGRRDQDGMSFGQMLSLYLGLTETEVTIGYKIMDIETTNATTGAGRVRLRPHLFIDPSTAITFTDKPDLHWDRNRLHDAWNNHLRFGALSTAMTFAGAVVEIIALPLGGGFRAIGTRLARQAGRRLLTRSLRRFRAAVLRRINRIVRRVLTTFFRSFAQAIVTEINAHLRQNRLREGFELSSIPINWPLLIGNTISSAVANTVSAEFSHAVGRRLKEWAETPFESLRDEYPFIEQPSPLEVFKHFLAQRAAHQFSGMIGTITEEVGRSISEIGFDPNNQDTFQQRLQNRMRQRLSGVFTRRLNSGFFKVLESFFEGRTLN